jgi:ubiquinone/menaquinone biosynthesis C-methylase UbiE
MCSWQLIWSDLWAKWLDGSKVRFYLPALSRVQCQLKDMIDLVRRNAKAKGVKPPHVAFVQAALSGELPIESASADCVLSNCVVNLLPGPGKASIFKEVFRVLKPNGRINLVDVRHILRLCLSVDLLCCRLLQYESSLPRSRMIGSSL